MSEIIPAQYALYSEPGTVTAEPNNRTLVKYALVRPSVVNTENMAERSGFDPEALLAAFKRCDLCWALVVRPSNIAIVNPNGAADPRKLQGELVGFVWVSLSLAEAPPLLACADPGERSGVKLLAHDEAFIYGGWIHPDHRRHRLASWLRMVVYEQMIMLEHENLFSIFNENDSDEMAFAASLGCELIERIDPYGG